MEENKNKAQVFCEIAKWLEKQDPEFTQHFPKFNSIIKVWLALPSDYNKSRAKVTNYILKNKGNYKADALAKYINGTFGFRYFDHVKPRFRFFFGLNIYNHTYKNGELAEVWLDVWDSFEEGLKRNVKKCTPITSLGDVRRAYDFLLGDAIEKHGDDYYISLHDSIKRPLKKKPQPTDHPLELQYYIPQ